jgi:hypothetical protein
MKVFSEYKKKLIFKQWVIGVCRINIETIIKSKKFDPEIKWLLPSTLNEFYADPFLLPYNGGNIKILFEKYKFSEEYGKLALMTLDNNFSEVDNKILLDTKSHLSYPSILSHNNKFLIFPEAAASGKLSCYQYDPSREKLEYIKTILPIPLLDSTIFRYQQKYWLFGVTGDNNSSYQLHIFYSQNLLGPYLAHQGNPVISGLNGVRPAGNIIEVEGNFYRPTQNCKNNYGESISINKIIRLSENFFLEEHYMDICINKKRKSNSRIKSIHTLNSSNNLIVIDGKRWTFSPYHQYKKFLRDKRMKKIVK